MAYHKFYDSTLTEITSGNRLRLDDAAGGSLSRDTSEVGAWHKAWIRVDRGDAPAQIQSEGDTIISPEGTKAARVQLAAFTTGDTTGPAATPVSYGADLTITTLINESTGVAFWARAKADPTDLPSDDISVTFVSSGTVVAA
jgi:hypothetical protein